MTRPWYRQLRFYCSPPSEPFLDCPVTSFLIGRLLLKCSLVRTHMSYCLHPSLNWELTIKEFFFFSFSQVACRIYIPQLGNEPVPPALGAWGLNHWTTREVPGNIYIYIFFLVLPLYCYQPISLHPLAHMLSHVIPWTSAHQTPLSMDFSRQEYWSGLPFPSPLTPLSYFITQLCIS